MNQVTLIGNISGICFEELNDIKGVINQKKMNAYRFGDE